MIRRLHGWLVTRFLPVWAKETILEENKRLRAELEQQRAENRELRAYARGLEEGLSALGEEPRRIEGYQSGMWIVLDYYDVIVHIFHEQAREFYGLERLWADAPRVELAPG